MIRPRRSILFVPGSNSRALEKAMILRVDGVILDLEDSVAPDAKLLARRQVVDAVQAGGFGPREVFVRVNSAGTPWHDDDLAAAVEAAPDAILLPKVGTPDDVLTVGARLREMEADARTSLWAMIETPLALLNAAAIASTAKDSGVSLAGFVMGTNDLARETFTRIVPGRSPMVPWLMTCVAAARAYGLAILDGVYNDLGLLDGFAAECAEARDMGFDGKTLIHPSQIAPANAAFTPTPDDIAQARRIIAVFELSGDRYRGVIDLDGRMVERLHGEVARRTVAIAEAIAGREQLTDSR
jgi:citrate lyase subunit beta/citryl-CoA lyase